MKQKIVLLMLKGVASLPLEALYAVSDFLYLVVFHILGYRRKVVGRNLREAFPEKSPSEILKIEKEYYRFMCDIIVETVKLLHISEKEMAERVEVTNPEIVCNSVEAGRPVALLLGHYGNWEWVQEISRCFPEEKVGKAYKASIFRPLNSPLWDGVYKAIRSRWHSHILPQRNAVRNLLDPAKRPWICGFIADARPRSRAEAATLEFLNHHTSFIYGPETIGRKVGADFFFLEMDRVGRGRYRITFRRLDGEGEDEPYPVTREFWRLFEGVIKEKPAYWLWSHKRWKYDTVIDPVIDPQK